MRINVKKGEIQNTWFLRWNLPSAVEKCSRANSHPPLAETRATCLFALLLRNEMASKNKALVRKSVTAQA